MNAPDDYGPAYYAQYFSPSAHSIPYERSWHWQHFFSVVATETIRALRPRRVLDAGCAMGFLVEQFWERGVHCEGIDISEYAISQVRRDIKEYCSVGSLTAPIPGRYDLITCIETLEHLYPEQLKTAAGNLCAAADTILFSSTPSAFDEPTHYSVRPPIFWLKLFAEFGFSPDPQFDAAYVAPHAMLLRKGAGAVSEDFLILYAEYIRQKIFVDAKTRESSTFENQLKALEREYRQSIADRHAAEHALFRSLHERDRLIHETHSLVNDRNVLADRVNQVQATLHEALNSRVWRTAEKVRGLLRGTPAPASAPADPASAAPVPALSAPAAPYQLWISEFESDLPAPPTSGPLISVIVPAHQTDAAMLRECVQSVLTQTYANWQLCLANDSSANGGYLRDLAKQDARILVTETSAKGISENSNAALALATGDYVAFLDHDDTLAPFALAEIAARVNAEPDVDLIYSDHDYLDGQTGARTQPLFKPDWSPAILFSSNYLTHLTVSRRSVLNEVGGFDPATDGAQDWDLFLRISEKTQRISHIAKILYHWRMHPASTAHNDSAKNYAAEAQLLALTRHMQRTGLDAQPEVLPNGLLHVKFNQTPTGKVSILIPTKDRLDLLSRCIDTLLSVTQYPNFEILIIDTGSKEQATQDYFASVVSAHQNIRVLWHPGPFNYSSVNNRAAREARGDFLLFLNNDVEITRPDWLTELVSWASLPGVGTVGGKLLRANGLIQHAGVVVGMNGFADHPFADGPALTFGLAGSTGWYRNFLAVTGACLMMRHEVFRQIGGFDENFVLCGSDVELCLRVHTHGYQVIYNPFAELIHHERQTRGTAIPPGDFVESLKHYRRWIVAGDPYWNPNLSLWSQQPAFNERKLLSGIGRTEQHVAELQAQIPPPVRTDADVWVNWFDCAPAEFGRVRQHNAHIHGAQAVKRVMWFIPAFEVPFYGGIYTILRFADYWKREKGVDSYFALCGGADRLAVAARIRQVYSAVQDEHVFVIENAQQQYTLPDADASICTLWTTAYYALRYHNVGRRFYLIQDYEPAFYPAGSVSALVESTYRMGLYGIANTVSLQQMYEAEYGGQATHFTPRVNSSVFYAAEPGPANPLKPLQVFCYGRPKHARNAFELVKQAMLQLKQKMGDKIRIVSAGDDWQPAEYGVQGVIDNFGLLSYEETGRLYRESQVGVVMMLTRHPSYIPLELMACGCTAVTNINNWTGWLLKDGENCLLAEATAAGLSQTVERALLDLPLREEIRGNALEMVRTQFLDWSSEAERIYSYLCEPEAAGLAKGAVLAGRG